MIFDNGIGRGESETVALRLGGEVRIEDALETLLGNADAFIADRDANVIAGQEVGDRRRSVRVVNEIVAAHAQRAAVGHGLIGVHDEIRDDLAYLAGINFRRPQIGAEEEFASAVRAAQGKADRILNEFSNGRGLLYRSAAAGEGEKLLGQITGAQRSVFRDECARTCGYWPPP